MRTTTEEISAIFIEPVGKECKCIFPFEKHYVALALDELIKQHKEELTQIEKHWGEGKFKQLEEAGLVDLKGLIYPFKKIIDDLSIVKARFAAMPDCK